MKDSDAVPKTLLAASRKLLEAAEPPPPLHKHELARELVRDNKRVLGRHTTQLAGWTTKRITREWFDKFAAEVDDLAVQVSKPTREVSVYLVRLHVQELQRLLIRFLKTPKNQRVM